MKNVPAIPDHIQEEYYQIAKPILESFPKYRPPLDLFEFKEKVGRLQPYCRKDVRLTNEQVDEVHALCTLGNLFVSRADYPIYSKHILKQLDLVLQDKHLKEGEIANIIIEALQLRVKDFCEQPVMPVFQKLYSDTIIFTEFLEQDPHRSKLFMRRLCTEHSIANHSVNTLNVGMWLFFKTRKEFRRRDIDRCALALLLHDIGMCKVPPFILTKEQHLKIEEKDKILGHPLLGAKTMHKLGLNFDEMRQAILEHHERLDGSGYPQKSKEKDISRFGRLVAVADSFCAMLTKRPYAEAVDPKEAAAALAKASTRYDNKYASLLHTAYVTGTF